MLQNQQEETDIIIVQQVLVVSCRSWSNPFGFRWHRYVCPTPSPLPIDRTGCTIHHGKCNSGHQVNIGQASTRTFYQPMPYQDVTPYGTLGLGKGTDKSPEGWVWTMGCWQHGCTVPPSHWPSHCFDISLKIIGKDINFPSKPNNVAMTLWRRPLVTFRTRPDHSPYGDDHDVITRASLGHN